jgi:hypothetical protein
VEPHGSYDMRVLHLCTPWIRSALRPSTSSSTVRPSLGYVSASSVVGLFSKVYSEPPPPNPPCHATASVLGIMVTPCQLLMCFVSSLTPLMCCTACHVASRRPVHLHHPGRLCEHCHHMALECGQPQPGALGSGEDTLHCTSAALRHTVLSAGV